MGSSKNKSNFFTWYKNKNINRTFSVAGNGPNHLLAQAIAGRASTCHAGGMRVGHSGCFSWPGGREGVAILRRTKLLGLLIGVSCKKDGEISSAVFLGNLKSLVIAERPNSSEVCKQQNTINGTACARNGIACCTK
jgi:hypothetical protein